VLFFEAKYLGMYTCTTVGEEAAINKIKNQLGLACESCGFSAGEDFFHRKLLIAEKCYLYGYLCAEQFAIKLLFSCRLLSLRFRELKKNSECIG
jgi:hypothetical protein